MPSLSLPSVRAVAVAVAVLLVGSLTGLATVDGDGASKVESTTPPTSILVSPPTTAAPGAPPAPSTTAAPATSTETEMSRLISELQVFVEKARGLKFKEPVKVTLLSDKAFRAKLADKTEFDEKEVDELTRILRALDLIDEGVDIAEEQRKLLGGAVLGYYDIKTKDLVVRGGKPTPAVRDTLVHELVHALQDQHFGVERDLDKKDDESSQSFSGLIEGDAVRIEQAYLKTMSLAEQNQVRDEQSEGSDVFEDVPPVLIQTLTFPYLAGPPFVQTVVRTAGQARLDEAFRTPPTTSEHLLHPDKFLAGEPAMAVAAPPANGTVIDEGVFGEFGFMQQLQDVIEEPDALRRAASGWGGDRYVAWDEGKKTCVRVDVVMDTPRDADELRAALRAWVDEHEDTATLEGDSPIRFTSCA